MTRRRHPSGPARLEWPAGEPAPARGRSRRRRRRARRRLVLRLRRGHEFEDAAGRSAHRIREGNAGDIAERVDLPGGVLTEPEQREGEFPSGQHVELADLPKILVVALRVDDEEPPVVVRSRREFEEPREVTKDVLVLETVEERAVIHEPTDDRMAFVMRVVLRDGLDETLRDRPGRIRRRIGEAVGGAVDVEEQRPLLEVPAVVATL